jgi:anthranilate phosphoribosyltransferase
MRAEDLSREEASRLIEALLDGEAADSQIAAALIALAIKGETVEEITGMAAAVRSRAVRIHPSHARFIDTAGTGSSATKTFNVSTAAAFVIAGAGLPVAKHGNRAATSRSGSADVLTALGVNIGVTPECSKRCLDETGICFMFSPLYHSATARVAAIRRELGVRTTFNILGPLSNPAAAPRQLIGVWQRSLVEPMARTLAALGSDLAWVVYGADGLDEVTLAAETFVAETRSGNIRMFEIAPEDFGVKRSSIAHLCGGEAQENAGIILSILDASRRDEARDLVLLNAAAALLVGGLGNDFRHAKELAEQSIDSGAAIRKLEQLIQRTNDEL